MDVATTTPTTSERLSDDVVCEIACVSPMVIAAAVGTATKGIEEDAPASEPTPELGRGGGFGRVGDAVKATTMDVGARRIGGGMDAGALGGESGGETTRNAGGENGTTRDADVEAQKKRKRRRRQSEKPPPQGVVVRNESVRADKVVVPDDDDSRDELDPGEEPYVRFEHLFGAADKFVKSGSRARGAQVEMYVQDYMERNVYGYAHVSVRTKKGRGRNVSRDVTMKRRTVGRGRPEDALDFPERVADKRTPTTPPLQSLPMAFAMARGDKIAVVAKPPTPAKKTPAESPRRATTQPKPQASLGVAPPPLKLQIPETIFDDYGPDGGEDAALMLNDDMMFWDVLGGGVEHTERGADAAARTVANMCAAREATQSPSVQSGETESPKSACLNAVERRVHALELKLAHAAAAAVAQAKSASPSRPPRKSRSRASFEEHADDRGGLQAINPRAHSPQFDDTANREMSSLEAAAKKQRSSRDDGEREHATSAPSSLQVERLNEAIITLERRQQRMEIERAKHLDEMLHMQHEHRKSVETIIETYERKIELLKRGQAMSSAEFSPTQLRTPPVYHPYPRGEASRHHHSHKMMGGAFTAPHHERSGKDPREYTEDTYAPPMHGSHGYHHHHLPRHGSYESFPSSYRPDDRRTYSEPRHGGAFGSVLERELESLEHALRRKNEVIASLSRELGSGGHWN